MKMKVKIFFIVFFCLAAAACDTVLGPPGYEPVLSDQPGVFMPLDTLSEGEPDANFITAKGGYYIWRMGDTWNVRVARTDLPHVTYPKDVFVGTVTVERGFVANVMNQNVKPFDEVRSTPKDIVFRLETERQREVKGISFRIQPLSIDYCISLDLRINGMVNPRLVNLGRSLYVPDSVPVTICVRR